MYKTKSSEAHRQCNQPKRTYPRIPDSARHGALIDQSLIQAIESHRIQLGATETNNENQLAAYAYLTNFNVFDMH